MVGKKLETRKQREIVTNMSGMKDPWICAHGRPTMRYIIDIPDFMAKLKERYPMHERAPPNLRSITKR